jgi:hypothetical protein
MLIYSAKPDKDEEPDVGTTGGGGGGTPPPPPPPGDGG